MATISDGKGSMFSRNPFLYAFAAFVIMGLYVLFTYLNIIPVSGFLVQDQPVIESDIVQSLFVLLFGIGVIEAFGRGIYYYMIKGINKAEAKTLSMLFRVLAYGLLALTILTILIGIQNISGILVGAGFLGIVVGLAAQSTISNLIAGIYLLASKTIEPGDYVNIHTWQYTMQAETYPHDKFIPGFAGTIESIGVLYTKLIHDDGSVPLYIPNNIVAQAMVLNYHRAKEHKIKLQFDISVKVPFETANRAISAAMKRHKITGYATNIEYLHTDIYVVSVRFDAVEVNIRKLKSDIFDALIKDMNAARKQ